MHHHGIMKFQICNLDEAGEETNGCFRNLSVNGTDILTVDPKIKKHSRVIYDHLKVRLPRDLVCDHCVFRWIHIPGKFIIMYLEFCFKYKLGYFKNLVVGYYTFICSNDHV